VKRHGLVIGLLVACVLASLLSYGLHRRPRTAGVAAPADSVRAPGVKTVRLYFGAVSGDSLVSEVRELAEATTLHDRVAGLVAELDLGPRGHGVAVLPAGTSVLHVYLDDHGLMTLDLSGAFRQRFRGGSATEYLAIASLVRTLNANLPEVKRLLVVCGGRPIASLGGHLALDRPLEIGDWP
jgi:hypothetical protein